MRVKVIWIRGKGGAALITAIVFVFFLTLFGLAFYRLGETDIDLFGYDKDLSKALYASEAGIDKVRWMLRESHLIPGANPFRSAYNEEAALTIANPTGGDFFPGEEDKAYFKVTEIMPELLPTGLPGNRVKVQTFGSVDVDADGEAGLTPIGGGKYNPDPDDVNRRFEAYIGLPGTLGARFGIKGISAAAGAFYAGGIQVNLSPEPRPFRTPDGDYVKDRNGNDRFLYFLKGTYGGTWDQWGFIFSDPAPTVASGEIDEIMLPPGIFDETGEFIDEDNNTIPDYFQDLDLRIYTGDPDFNFSNDPTAGAEGRNIIYFNGNITITGVDFGHLNDQGDEIKNCDWECGQGGKKEVDLTFIANGKITLNRIDCGNVGRLVLVAKDIELVGDYATKVNGIAIASNDITLDGHLLDGGSWCEYGILTHQTDFSRPVKYAAYFLGSMVAGNHINLQNDGWTVIYDENVINGYMYSTILSKPTLTYERVEAEDFNSSNNWQLSEAAISPEMAYTQGIYTQDEKDAMQGDYTDVGVDDVPEVIRVYTRRGGWKPDMKYWTISESLYLDFSIGDFEDPDIRDSSMQNWDYYDTITFWMALDNFKRPSTDGTKTTSREARYEIVLIDSNGNTFSIPLNNLYPESKWGTVKYHHTGSPEEYMNEIRDLDAGEKANGESYSQWKRVKITTKHIDPGTDFDFSKVMEFRIKYVHMKVSWTVDTGKPDATMEFRPTREFWYTDENGSSWIMDEKRREGNLNDRTAASDGYYYLYNHTADLSIRWYEDPNSSTDVRMREEVLMPTLRIDRLELPGKPATNDFLEYGLPYCLRLEITNWKEL